MQNFKLIVTQDEVNIIAEGLNLLTKANGLAAVLPIATLVNKIQQAVPEVTED